MPEMLGRYELERRIAAGGMGEVHLARQAGPGGFSRKCVIKRMHAAVSRDPEFVRMFLAEARVTAHLSHPNIAQLYDFGQADGVYYLAIEYVPGASLHALNRTFRDSNRFVPTAASLKIIAEAARALEYAHTALDEDGKPLRLVHRDVSPGNVLVSTSGGVKLIDFGVAKVAAASVVTQNGVVKGKIQYMAPEQVMGEPIDARTDLYSLGLVLYELLTGKRAFAGAQLPQIVVAVGRNQFPPLPEARPGLTPGLYALAARALATRPADRFASAGQFADALDAELAAMRAEVPPAQIAALATEAVQWMESQSALAAETAPGKTSVPTTRERPGVKSPVPLGDDQAPTQERPLIGHGAPTLEFKPPEEATLPPTKGQPIPRLATPAPGAPSALTGAGRQPSPEQHKVSDETVPLTRPRPVDRQELPTVDGRKAAPPPAPAASSLAVTLPVGSASMVTVQTVPPQTPMAGLAGRMGPIPTEALAKSAAPTAPHATEAAAAPTAPYVALPPPPAAPYAGRDIELSDETVSIVRPLLITSEGRALPVAAPRKSRGALLAIAIVTFALAGVAALWMSRRSAAPPPPPPVETAPPPTSAPPAPEH